MSEPLPPVDITPAVYQRLVWDIVPCDEVDDMWEEMDLVPPSGDVAEAMHQESHARMDSLAPIAPPVEVYVVLTAEVISASIARHAKQGIDAEFAGAFMEQVIHQNKMVIRSAVYPLLARLFEEGYIVLGPNAMQTTVFQ